MDKECAFCAIVAGTEPAEILHRDNMTMTIVPLNPVTKGHLLVIPIIHVPDFTTKPSVSAFVMYRASAIAAEMGSCNVITSRGHEATQSVFHLHLHIVPRFVGDGLALPWTPGSRKRS